MGRLDASELVISCFKSRPCYAQPENTLDRHFDMHDVDKMKDVCHEQRQSIPTYMELLRLVAFCEDLPMPRQFVATDIRQPADLPHRGWKFALEEFENVPTLELSRDHRWRNVIEVSTFRGSQQLDGQTAPFLDRLPLS